MLCTHAAAYLVCARPRPLENCAIFLFAVTERVELFGGGGRQPRNNRTVRKETAADGGVRDHTAEITLKRISPETRGRERVGCAQRLEYDRLIRTYRPRARTSTKEYNGERVSVSHARTAKAAGSERLIIDRNKSEQNRASVERKRPVNVVIRPSADRAISF